MKFRWRVWTERIKSAFLVLLVTVSLVLSALLWTGTPTEVAVDHPNFYSSPLYGSERSVGEFIRPSAIWLWTANTELFRIGGTSETAGKILNQINKATFISGGLVSDKNQNVDIPPKTPYLMLDYNSLLQHSSMWSLAINVKNMNVPFPTNQMVSIVPLFKNNEYKLIFPYQQKIYIGYLRLPTAFDGWLHPGVQAIPYAQIPQGNLVFSLPYASMTMPLMRWVLYRPVATHVIDSFFVDPSLVEPIQIGKQRAFYTDGIQSVQMSQGPFGNQLAFSCPSQPLNGFHQSANSAVQVAVPFMDSHGGFVGDQVLSQVKEMPDRVLLTFQDVVNGWPLFSQLNQIRVRVQNGMVTGLWHSLSYPGIELTEGKERILSGVQLFAKLHRDQLKGLSQVTLGYGTQLRDSQNVYLIPVYRLHYQSNKNVYLNARTGQFFSGMGM